MKQYFHIVALIALALTGILAAGCSSMPGGQSSALSGPVDANQSVKPAPAAQSQQAQRELPGVELTPDLLYDLMTAEIAGYRGRLDVSIKHYLTLAERTRDPRIIERATRIAVYARDDKSALQAARLWVEIEPQRHDARQMLATFLIKNGQTEAALVHLRFILSTAQDTEKSFYLVATLLGRGEDKVQALEVMRKLIAGAKDNAGALHAYSFLAEQAGKLEIARESIERALELKPHWINAIISYARILQRQNNTPKALSYLKGLLEDQPTDAPVRLIYARLLVDAKNLVAAREQFDVIAKQMPENADIVYTSGVLALQAEDLDSAEQYFTKLSRLGKRQMEANYYLGYIAESRNKFEQAIEWYSAVTHGESFIDARIRVATLLAKQNKLGEARDFLHTTQTRESSHIIRLYLVEGELLRNVNENAKALTVYEDGLVAYPDNSELLYAHSMAAEKLDMMDVMERDLRTIIKHEPDNAHALNALGYTLTDRTDRHQEALEFIKRAHDLRPQDAAILDSLGWVKYRLGKYKEAAKHLRRALELNNDAEIAAHLGEVLWVAGDAENAYKVLSQALESAPDDKNLLKVMEKFKK